jgi:hypothetical protein
MDGQANQAESRSKDHFWEGNTMNRAMCLRKRDRINASAGTYAVATQVPRSLLPNVSCDIADTSVRYSCPVEP